MPPPHSLRSKCQRKKNKVKTEPLTSWRTRLASQVMRQADCWQSGWRCLPEPGWWWTQTECPPAETPGRPPGWSSVKTCLQSEPGVRWLDPQLRPTTFTDKQNSQNNVNIQYGWLREVNTPVCSVVVITVVFTAVVMFVAGTLVVLWVVSVTLTVVLLCCSVVDMVLGYGVVV